MTTVTCTKCGNKDLAYDGRSECMPCSRLRFSKYYKNNRKRVLARIKDYDKNRRVRA